MNNPGRRIAFFVVCDGDVIHAQGYLDELHAQRTAQWYREMIPRYRNATVEPRMEKEK